jgi:glutamine amidotransferase
MNADGFGIGWYDDVGACQQGPASGIAGANGAASENELSFSPETHPGASAMDLEGHAIDPDDADPLEDQRKADVARVERRKIEADEERERPCLFKSISPVCSSAIGCLH